MLCAFFMRFDFASETSLNEIYSYKQIYYICVLFLITSRKAHMPLRILRPPIRACYNSDSKLIEAIKVGRAIDLERYT